MLNEYSLPLSFRNPYLYLFDRQVLSKVALDLASKPSSVFHKKFETAFQEQMVLCNSFYLNYFRTSASLFFLVIRLLHFFSSTFCFTKNATSFSQFWNPSDFGGPTSSQLSSRYLNDFEELKPLGNVVWCFARACVINVQF